jgi:hypothetical protein
MPDIGVVGLGLSILIVLIEWLQRKELHPADISKWSFPVRVGIYASVIV